MRSQTLTLLEKLNELDADEQADICESLHDHADELYRSCLARSGKLPTLAPPLLRQLAAIGNNLNQTARKVNSGQWSSGDRV
ncbi:Rop family plasmid primer RNA-binding protein, partial [Escherichia coli]|uniref:Rop family plasmid primer RNA-binding protein n=1 Tax=Escherichia coli TaxID=562 RepID=UPI003EDF2823